MHSLGQVFGPAACLIGTNDIASLIGIGLLVKIRCRMDNCITFCESMPIMRHCASLGFRAQTLYMDISYDKDSLFSKAVSNLSKLFNITSLYNSPLDRI